MLKQLIETQPVNFISMLGQDKFFQGKRYRAAIVCFNRYLETSPDDVSIRLNLANAYNRVGMYNQAEAAVNHVIDHNLGVSDYGVGVAYENKSTAALGRKDYRNGIDYAYKSFEANPNIHPLFTVQLAAAQLGNMRALETAVQKLQEFEPPKYIELKLEIDAVDAYAMFKSNNREGARKLVRAWKDLDRAEGKVISFWRQYPDGMDVARTWAQLMQN